MDDSFAPTLMLVTIVGVLVFGIGAYAGNTDAYNAIERQCQKGYTWKSMDFTYHCTAEQRP